MNPVWWWLTIPGAVVWASIIFAPWRAWSTRESLDSQGASPDADLSGVTVLIPARDEAAVIGRTIAALAQQGRKLRVVLVDDQSTDGTAEIAERQRDALDLTILKGSPLPPGWAGKLWALEQGRRQVTTPWTLLLDADIELAPGTISTLLAHKRDRQLQLVSLMARLNMANFWERLLLPAFVYFFMLLYPFSLSNSRNRLIAAAAGGFILVDTPLLDEIGAFASLRDALIDDCTLARRVKNAGHRTWIGLTHSAVSLRAEHSFADMHQMVARSAFTQLGYSTALLLAVSAIFAAAFWLPFAAAVAAPAPIAWLALATIAGMFVSYVPVLRYYGLAPRWALALPAIATLYLGMTWSSAIRYWRGVRSRWKGRVYEVAG